jgi:hypothetical protein
MKRYRRSKSGRVKKEVFERNFDKSQPHWLWNGFVSSDGYGQYGYQRRAHVVAYELYVGPVPKGLEIDHLCGILLCVKPDHLEAVTKSENIRRYYERRRAMDSDNKETSVQTNSSKHRSDVVSLDGRSGVSRFGSDVLEELPQTDSLQGSGHPIREEA